MSKQIHATGTIESKSWNFEPIEELDDGGKLIRMTAVDVFHGDIEGEAQADFVAFLRPDNSSSFAGFYRFAGSVGGCRGAFALQTTGSGTAGGLSQGNWTIASGSASGALTGLVGAGGFSYQRGGASSLWLDYQMAE